MFKGDALKEPHLNVVVKMGKDCSEDWEARKEYKNEERYAAVMYSEQYCERQRDSSATSSSLHSLLGSVPLPGSRQVTSTTTSVN